MRKTHSRLRSLLCMLLAMLMVVSCFTIGIVSVSANSVDDGIYLRGTMNGWGTSEEYKFTHQGNNIYTLVVNLAGGTYTYKVATPSWNAVNIGNGSADASITLDSDAVVMFTANLNNRTQSYVRLDKQADFTLGSTALTIEAEDYTYIAGELSALSDAAASGGKYVGDFDEGDTVNYGVTVDKAQTYRFTIDVASEAGDGEFNFIAGDDATMIDFTGTDGWQDYKSVVITKTLSEGFNRIAIENTFGTYNVDKIYVEPVSDYADEVKQGTTTLDFSGYDSISDTALVEDGVFSGTLGDAVSIIVTPETVGSYNVSIAGAMPSKTLLLGDADLDDKVNVKDATAVQKATAQLITLSEDAELCADVDESDSVNVKDATAIQKYVAGLETGYAIGEYFTVGGAALLADNAAEIVVYTSEEDIQIIDAENPVATLVLDGETEVFVEANGEEVLVPGLTFEYTKNVEAMGYEFMGSDIDDIGYVGVRFAYDYIIDEIKLVPLWDMESATLILSNGVSYELENLKEGQEYSVKPEGAAANWVALKAEDNGVDSLEILGVKDDADTEKDIVLEGYASTINGWTEAKWYPCNEMDYSKKFGFGFDKEVTANKVTFTSFSSSLPETVTMTIATGEKIELEGIVEDNDNFSRVTFDLDEAYSYGFYFEFDEEILVSMIQAEGDLTNTGAITNASGKQDYELFANGLVEDDSRVIANDGYTILSNETGADRVWTLKEDIYESPAFYAPNTPLAEAAYNLTMEEIYKSINLDATFGEVFYTGTNWQKVWTRDTAISMQYILSWLFPEISTNCAEAKVVGKDGHLTFEEDTGTGGSYPVSTDRIIMMLACWETYLADGNLESLEYFYEVASNTIEQDYDVVYDAEAGLFRGETCGLDHRDKTYGDWTGEDDQNGIVNIAEGKAASTNIIYCQVMNILSEAATILGKGEAESKAWAELAADLEEAISTRLWHDELGTYASWEYPDWMGSPLSYKQDVLADGYAVWYNIGTEEQVNSIMENHTLVNFGANTVYPQKNAQRWTDYKYHDSGVWPGWEALLMIGAVNNDNENNLLAEEIWNSCVRGAASCLTNYEVIDYETGEGCHSTQQLWSVAGTMAGYYRVLFGMEYTTEGITFDPYVPQWMQGPFYLYGLKYRDAVVDIELFGDGDTIESMYVNGDQVENDYVLPVDAEGEYLITINLEDSGAVDTVNLKDENTAKAPTAPTNVTLTGTTLKWSGGTTNNVTYKVWTGSEYVDVTGTTYEIDATAYGCFSVVAVDKTTGLWSELSKPVTYSPAGSNVTHYVGNHIDKAGANALTVTMTVPVDGVYQLSAVHSNTGVGDPTSALTASIRSVYIDGENAGSLVFPISNFGHQNSSHLRLELTAGTHEITIKYDDADWYDRNMDQAHGGNTNNVTYHMIQLTLTDGDFSSVEGEEGKTIYFTNNKGWEKVYAHYWGGNNGSEWPGVEMTYAGKNPGGEDVYSITIDPSITNILFLNGSGEQTEDITSGVQNNAGFYLDAKNGEKWTTGTWTCNPDDLT